jgi:hypothetical protein
VRSEAEVARLGLTVRTELPGMTVAPEELADVTVDSLEIVRVDDDEGLAEAARVTAVGFGVAIEMMRGLFVPELAGSGVSYHLGRRLVRRHPGTLGQETALGQRRPGWRPGRPTSQAAVDVGRNGRMLAPSGAAILSHRGREETRCRR